MKCPYCAEWIREEAVVCKHCGRDFSLVQPLLGRVQRLEDALGRIRREQPAESQHFPAFLAAALGVVCTSGYLLVGTGLPLPTSDNAVLLLMGLPPAVLGLLVGATWRGSHAMSYLAAGFAMGCLNLAGARFVLASLETEPTFSWTWAIAIFVVGQTLLFWLGGLTGDSLEGLWSKRERPVSSFDRLLKWLIRGNESLRIVVKLITALGGLIAATKGFLVAMEATLRLLGTGGGG